MPGNEQSELRVKVTTALGAYPISGASVTVSSESSGERRQLYSVPTGIDGLTPVMLLDAPPRSNSLSPDGGAPYALYTVEVAAEGFTPLTALNVAVFAEVPAVLPVQLTPLPENIVRGETEFTSEGEQQTLTQPMLPERGANDHAR